MFLALLFSVFLASVLAGLTGRWLGTRGVSFMAVVLLAVSLLCSLAAVLEILLSGSTVSLSLGSWFQVGTICFNWSFSFNDPLLCATVCGVSLLVHLFSAAYTSSDPSYTLGMCWLSLFTFFMLVLAAADHLLVLLVGWEGIGVCSFALIGFWKSRLAATKSALKAVWLWLLAIYSRFSLEDWFCTSTPVGSIGLPERLDCCCFLC